MVNEYINSNSSEPNCTHPSICDFPQWLSSERPQYDQVAIAFLISFYLFAAVAVVCDEFFVPSVERLCFYFKLSTNVGGATFMAAATSSPEFFINMIGTFITESDIGIGTITRSSVFNSLAIAGCCGVFSGVTVGLDWWPISRDIFWYLFAVTILTYFLKDSIIVWYEPLILISIYFVYLTSLLCDQRIQDLIRVESSKAPECFKSTNTAIMSETIARMDTDPHMDLKDDDFYKFCTFPRAGSFCGKLWWIVSWPLQLICAVTIPDCRKEKYRNFFVVSLLMSIVWISLITYAVSWTVTIVGYNLRIHEAVMGVTLLAIGTSMPEAVTSIIVTRKGYGSMALCNSIASNTFDIFICLGFPWFIRTVTQEDGCVHFMSTSLTFDSISLMLTGGLFYICFVMGHFTIGHFTGSSCLFMYVLYLIITTLVEHYILEKYDKPPCENCFQAHIG